LQVLELEGFALFVTTRDGRITTWNRGIEKPFGYMQQEWLGHYVIIIFNEEDLAAGVVENEMTIRPASRLTVLVPSPIRICSSSRS
jgi:PAS domain S-box-containing protein